MKISFGTSRVGMIGGAAFIVAALVAGLLLHDHSGFFIVAVLVGAFVCYGSQIANIRREKELRTGVTEGKEKP